MGTQSGPSFAMVDGRVQDDDDVAPALAELIGLLPDNETFEETLDRIVTLARATVPGCDSGSITLTGEGRAGHTVVGTDPVALAIDEGQYEEDRGPCLEAARTGTVVHVPALADENRWPEYQKAAMSNGIASSLSLPLHLRGTERGALNLYAHRAEAFGKQSQRLGVLFAAQSSVALANAQLLQASRKLAAQLEEALASRAIIERAKGMLMSQRGFDEETAFAMLRQASQRENLKLREVARRLVESHQPTNAGSA